jgi:predicted RNA-binding protein with PIN domain
MWQDHSIDVGVERPAGQREDPRIRRWLVDGMNVIGSRPDGWWNDPDGAVRRLIDLLERYASQTGDDVTVVFDRKPRDVAAGAHGPITVAFPSQRGRDAADHEIAKMVADDKAPASLTVVTSDRALAHRVRQRSGRVASAGSFRRRLDGVQEGASWGDVTDDRSP